MREDHDNNKMILSREKGCKLRRFKGFRVYSYNEFRDMIFEYSSDRKLVDSLWRSGLCSSLSSSVCHFTGQEEGSEWDCVCQGGSSPKGGLCVFYIDRGLPCRLCLGVVVGTPPCPRLKEGLPLGLIERLVKGQWGGQKSMLFLLDGGDHESLLLEEFDSMLKPIQILYRNGIEAFPAQNVGINPNEIQEKDKSSFYKVIRTIQDEHNFELVFRKWQCGAKICFDVFKLIRSFLIHRYT